MSSRMSRTAAGAAFLAASLATTTVGADDRLRISVDWGKVAEVLRDGASLLPREKWHPTNERGSVLPSAHQLHWLGASPHVSLIARDWGGHQLLFGELTLLDLVRLSRSSRMVLSRVRIADGRVAPFVQVGLGQWRVDTDVMPFLPGDVEIAGQVGGGFEVALGPGAAVALVADCTILYREQHEPQMITAAHLWGTLFAARAQF